MFIIGVQMAGRARTLRRHLRGEDVSARHGGDEFTVLLTDLPGGGPEGAEAATATVAHLHEALDEGFVIDGTRHRAAVTIGTALFPSDGSTVRDLVARADADMYRRKRSPSRLDLLPGRGASA